MGMRTRVSGAGEFTGSGVYGREAAVQLPALAPVLYCRKGWGQLPAWLGRKSSGTELGHWLLPSLPNEAVAWVSYIHPLVSKPTQKINGSVFIWGGLVLHWTQAEDNGRYSQWLHTDFLWDPCNEAIYPAQGWALSPISDWNSWMEHSWPPHQASHSHSTDVALRGGHSKVAASGFVGEVLAIGFFPSSV